MEFCPTCGSFLSPTKSNVGTDFAVVLACAKCGFIKRGLEKRAELKVSKVIQPNPQEPVTIISQEDQKIKTMPTLRMECDKCGNNTVYVWQVQTRGGDEASTQFMRCTKCSHTFREYT
jgi:transcription factor S